MTLSVLEGEISLLTFIYHTNISKWIRIS